MMISLMNDVTLFHYATGGPADIYPPQLANPARAQLRAALILEEALETVEALKEGDLVEIADGLADIVYVVVGTALEYGIPLHRVWDEVQRSNMAKVDPATGQVNRREDGKILKPPGWTPPDIKGILKAYGADLE